MPTSSAASMRAVVLAGAGGVDVLELRGVPRPVPGTGEILVRVHATALNRADLLQRAGRYPAPAGAPRDIPGIEFAGEVAALGPGAAQWSLGARVFGLVGGGAQADYLVTHERAVAEVPESVTWSEAGAAPEAFITAHDALITQAAVRPSESVVVHAVGSGVGLAAVQLTRAVGAVPFGTTRTAAKLDAARAHGVEDGVVLDDGVAALPDCVARWTRGHGADIVLDLVGGPYVMASVESLATHGRLMLIGTIAGGTAQLPLGRVLGGRLTIRGTVLRARPIEERILATRAFAAQVVPLLAKRTVHPVIDSEFPLERIREAHERLESGATIGKVVIRVSDAR